jgi:magnesium chelatase family protein
VGELLGAEGGDLRPIEPTAAVAERVAVARHLAAARGVGCNAELPAAVLDASAPLDAEARRLLEARLRQGRLSARGLHRVRRVARTLADLAGRGGAVGLDDVHTALALRADVFGPSEVAA